MKKILFFLVSCLLSLSPLLASAISLPYFGGDQGAIVSCSGVNCTTCDLFETGQRIIYFIMTLTLFVIGPIMITAGGIMMLISAGNEEKFTTGRKMATGAVIGILIAIGAFLIVNTLLWAVAKQIPGFSGSGFTISCDARSPLVPYTATPTYTDPSLRNATPVFTPAGQYSPPAQDNPGGNTETF